MNFRIFDPKKKAYLPSGAVSVVAMTLGCEKVTCRMEPNYEQSWHVDDCLIEWGVQLSNGEVFYVNDIVNYVTGIENRKVKCLVCFGYYQTYSELKEINGKYAPLDEVNGDVEDHIGFYLQLHSSEVKVNSISKIPIGSVWIRFVSTIHDNPELFPQ